MNIIKITTIAFATLLLSSCGGSEEAKSNRLTSETDKTTSEAKKEVKKASTEISSTFDEFAPTLDNKGIGPIKSLTLGDIDEGMAATGKELFKINCTACHKFKKKYIGPALKGVMDRRSPEWIMNMMLNADEMLKNDPVALGLIAKYNAPMAQQQISEEESRAIVEYLRTKN